MDNPTHDVIPPPTFDKAWQRKQHHAPAKDAKVRAYLDRTQMYNRNKLKLAQERELVTLIKQVKRKAQSKDVVRVTYKEAAVMLDTTVAHVAGLVNRGVIGGLAKRRLVTLSSLEVYRDTRTR